MPRENRCHVYSPRIRFHGSKIIAHCATRGGREVPSQGEVIAPVAGIRQTDDNTHVVIQLLPRAALFLPLADVQQPRACLIEKRVELPESGFRSFIAGGKSRSQWLQLRVGNEGRQELKNSALTVQYSGVAVSNRVRLPGIGHRGCISRDDLLNREEGVSIHCRAGASATIVYLQAGASMVMQVVVNEKH